MKNNIYGDRTSSEAQKFLSVVRGERMFNYAYSLKRDVVTKVGFILELLNRIDSTFKIEFRRDLNVEKSYIPFNLNGKLIWIHLTQIKPYTSGETSKNKDENGDVIFNKEYYTDAKNTTRFYDAPWTNKLDGEKTFSIGIDRPTDSDGEIVEEDRLFMITETSSMMSSAGRLDVGKTEEVSKTAYLRQWEYEGLQESGILVRENKTKSSHKGKTIPTISFLESKLAENSDIIFEFITSGERDSSSDTVFKRINKIIDEEKYQEAYIKRRNQKLQNFFRKNLEEEVKLLNPSYYDMLDQYERDESDVNNKGLLVASHIEKFSSDKLNSLGAADPSNGLLLPAPYDSLFDKGLITFNKKGKIILSDFIKRKKIMTSMNLENISINSKFLTKERVASLAKHNEEFWINEYN